ncbi:hypothetical protein F2Q70_00035540 [Brassica cretica]|uniref:Uncharacterized protein n=1 Tax=Brassica cretica TaxID=69181 RepID=A0A8S9JSS8_BRACR|nr:hypothetical protein F2Q70_00035540 [Brassica cretica]
MEGESSNSPLRLGGVSEVASTSSQLGDGADKDERYDLNIQDAESMKSMQRPKRRKRSSSLKIVEVELIFFGCCIDFILFASCIFKAYLPSFSTPSPS